MFFVSRMLGHAAFHIKRGSYILSWGDRNLIKGYRQTIVTQNMIRGLAASTSAVNLLEMQNLRSKSAFQKAPRVI